jgi:hypothetical protein
LWIDFFSVFFVTTLPAVCSCLRFVATFAYWDCSTVVFVDWDCAAAVCVARPAVSFARPAAGSAAC